MKDSLSKLARHSAIYGIGNAIGIAGGFILIPIYTHVLSTGEYGILELLNRTADILILVMFSGIRQAFTRFYFDRDDGEWHKTVVSTTLAFTMISSLIIALLFLPFRTLLADTLFKESASGTLFVFIVIWIPLDLLLRIGLAHLQVQMKSIKYVSINFLRFVLAIGANIIFVYIYRKGIIGILTINIGIAALIGLTFLVWYIKWTRLRVSLRVMKELLKFGLPYLPTTFFMFLISSSDRYFLTAFSSLESVGVYALAYKIGMFGTSFIMNSFEKIWAPFLFGNYNKADGPTLISKVFTIYTFICVSAGLVISVSCPLVIPLISGEAFHDAYKLVPLICLSSVFYGMACLADAGILISKKTTYKPLIFGLASIIGVVCNLSLIPRFGSMGAAATLAITFFVLFVVNHYIANKFYPLKLEYRKLLLIFISALAVYLFFTYLLSLADMLEDIKIYSLFSLCLFPLIIWFGGFFSNEEKVVLKGLFTKLGFKISTAT